MGNRAASANEDEQTLWEWAKNRLVLALARFSMRAMIPARPFPACPAPAAPDYARAAAWAAHPRLAPRNAACECVPAGEPAPPPDAARAASVFFVKPTTFCSDAAWNEPVAARDGGPWPPSEEMFAHTLAACASAFNACCRVYAPRYRGACMAACGLEPASGRAAYDLAYADVARAFAHFLAELQPGEPWLLASHSQARRKCRRTLQHIEHDAFHIIIFIEHGIRCMSGCSLWTRARRFSCSVRQGGVHADRLLAECVDPVPGVRARMVAAYLVGSCIPRDKFRRSYPHLRPSAGATDAGGVVIGWDTVPEREGPVPAGGGWRGDVGIWYAEGWEAEATDKGFLCTSPLTWKTFGFESTGGAGERAGDAPAGDGDDGRGRWRGAALPVTSRDAPAGPGPLTGAEFYRTTREPFGMAVTGIARVDVRPAGTPGDGTDFFYARPTATNLVVPTLPRAEAADMLHKGMGVDEYHTLDWPLFYFNIRANVRERVDAFVEKSSSGTR